MTGKETIRGAIFDMDGVIFNTENVWRDAFVLANERFRAPLTERDRQAICGKSEASIRAAYRRLCPDLDVDAYRDLTIAAVQDQIRAGFIRLQRRKRFQRTRRSFGRRKIQTPAAYDSFRKAAAAYIGRTD